MDNAWEYHDGRSEMLMGKAIADRRERVFLMTKKRAVTAADALRYAMSLPVVTTVSGIDSMRVLRQNIHIATHFTRMSPREMEALRRRVRDAADDGRFELYKTTAQHEGPVGREQHGYPTDEEICA